MSDWKQAIVRVYSGKRGEAASEYRGTAFIVSDRWLLTCWHVVRDLGKDDICLYGAAAWRNGVRKIKRIISDENIDVALLELSRATDKPDFIPYGEQISIADNQLECAGFSSEDGDLDCFSVRVSSYRGEYNLYVFLGPVGKGMSGGPVLYQGKLIGIAVAI